MRYEYKELSLHLEGDEVYWLWDIVMFALDHDAEKKCLNDDKRAFARRLVDITNEMK